MTRSRRATVAGAAVVAVGAAVTVGAVFALGDGRASGEHRIALAAFTDQGVTVSVALQQDTGGTATFAVTFTPDRPGFHLYSADLPPDGVDGIGRPLSLSPGGVLRAAGRPTTDVAARPEPIAGAGVSVPVYPDGPVTATLPVTVTAAGPATLAVGYAACSATECLPPVTGHMIALRAGAASITASIIAATGGPPS